MARLRRGRFDENPFARACQQGILDTVPTVEQHRRASGCIDEFKCMPVALRLADDENAASLGTRGAEQVVATPHIESRDEGRGRWRSGIEQAGGIAEIEDEFAIGTPFGAAQARQVEEARTLQALRIKQVQRGFAPGILEPGDVRAIGGEQHSAYGRFLQERTPVDELRRFGSFVFGDDRQQFRPGLCRKRTSGKRKHEGDR